MKDWKTSSQLSIAQVDVLAGLTAAGQNAGVWRPEQWFSGQIRAELDAIRQRR